MDGTSLKTIAVFVIIFGCFVVLFPKLFYPLVLTIFNLHKTAENDQKEENMGLPRPIYEAMRKHDGKSKFSPSFSRMGAHPGMHAASEMKKMMANKQSVDSKGTLGYVLPLYAIGIVVYLVYTLSKLFAKRQNKPKLHSHRSFKTYADCDEDEAEIKEKVINKQKELEQLLWKADQELIGDDEMSTLKERLKETENQMTRILKAMETIQRTMASPAFEQEIVSEAYDEYSADNEFEENASENLVDNANKEFVDDYHLLNENQMNDFRDDGNEHIGGTIDNEYPADSEPRVRKRIVATDTN